MILPDVNILLYAFRNEAPEYIRFRQWLESVVTGSEAYGMSPQVLWKIGTLPRLIGNRGRVPV